MKTLSLFCGVTSLCLFSGAGSSQAQDAAKLAADVQKLFEAKCGACHSATGDLQGIGSRMPDPTALQNFWISAGNGLGRGGRGAPPSRRVMATVTPSSGASVEGAVVRIDDFYVVVQLAYGTQRSFRREGELPAIDLRDPLEPHKKLLPVYTDKDIHDVTAYLVTLK